MNVYGMFHPGGEVKFAAAPYQFFRFFALSPTFHLLQGVIFRNSLSIELGITDFYEKVLESRKEVPTNTTFPHNIFYGSVFYLSHSRAQKFVPSLVRSATRRPLRKS